MTAGSGEFTGNSDPDTVSLREWIAKHSDHLDAGIHELRQSLAAIEQDRAVIGAAFALITDMAVKLDQMHAELEAARPLLEKWQRSKIVKLASGGLPWGPQ